MNYYISVEQDGTGGAWNKARSDIESILEGLNFKKVVVNRIKNTNILIAKYKVKNILEYFNDRKEWKKIYQNVESGDVVLIQHPMSSFGTMNKYIKKMRARGIKFILVIHDIYLLRENQNRRNLYYRTRDIFLPNQCDVVISHNKYMTHELKKLGINKCSYVNLNIFDYLAENVKARNVSVPDMTNIVIAGNLEEKKAGYIYTDGWIKGKMKLQLYGSNYDESKNHNENVLFKGNYKPDELPNLIENGFGLVWDGSELNCCGGNTGEYLKINNPHKTSLYLAAGLPVIVWEKSAMADIVRKNNIGICIDTLFELEKRINDLSFEDYSDICANVKNFSEKIRNGEFFKEGLHKAMGMLKS